MNTCFFCGAVDLHGTAKYKMLSSKVPSSQKSVSLVLTHLASCMKTDMSLKSDTKLCPRCFHELAEYDTIMVNLMVTQKKLTTQLKAALKSEYEEDSLVEGIDKSAEEDAEAESLFAELVKEEDASGMDIKEEYEDDDFDEDDDDDDDEEFLCEVKPESVSVKLEEGSDNQGKFIAKRSKQECSTCGKCFNARYQLQKHINEEHSKTHAHVCPILVAYSD